MRRLRPRINDVTLGRRCRLFSLGRAPLPRGEIFAKLPDGWSLTDAASVAVISKDRIYVFNRGDHPMVVLDREGNFITSWGEGLFNRAHGLHIDTDDNLYCTDDGDHVRSHDRRQVLLTIGIPNSRRVRAGEPGTAAPIPRCRQGEIYFSDGYGNAVHKYSPDESCQDLGRTRHRSASSTSSTTLRPMPTAGSMS